MTCRGGCDEIISSDSTLLDRWARSMWRRANAAQLDRALPYDRGDSPFRRRFTTLRCSRHVRRAHE
jgi:hypothetical protein